MKRDEQRPFVVEADGVTVTVLGTAFEVNAFDTATALWYAYGMERSVWWQRVIRSCFKAVDMHVTTRVRTSWNECQLRHRRYGAIGSSSSKKRPWRKWSDSWNAFKVRVQFGNETLSRCKLTATFEDEPIDYILRVIADTYGAKFNMEAPATYLLSGDGC